MFLVQKRHLSIPEFYLKTQKNRQKLRKKANKNRNFVEKHIKNGYNKIMMIFVTSCYQSGNGCITKNSILWL